MPVPGRRRHGFIEAKGCTPRAQERSAAAQGSALGLTAPPPPPTPAPLACQAYRIYHLMLGKVCTF